MKSGREKQRKRWKKEGEKRMKKGLEQGEKRVTQEKDGFTFNAFHYKNRNK